MKKFLLLCTAFMALVCTADAQLANLQRSQKNLRPIEGTKVMNNVELNPVQVQKPTIKGSRAALEEYALNPLEFTLFSYLEKLYLNDFATVLTQSGLKVPNTIHYAQYISPEVASRFAGNVLKNVYCYFPEGAMEVTFWVKEDLYSEENVWEFTAEEDIPSGSYGAPYVVPCEYTINPKGFYFGMTVEKLAVSKHHYFFFGTTSRTNGSFIVDFGEDWYDFSNNGTLYFWYETEGENGLAEFDINMDYATISRVAPQEKVNMSSCFTNMGSMPLTQVQLKYMLDGVEKTVDVDIVDQNGNPDTLTFLDYYEFTFPETAPATPGRYPMTLEANLLNEKYTDYYTKNAANSVQAHILSINDPFNRVAVMEQFTGTGCGWCPRGHVAMKLLNEKYPNDFIGIAVHAQDNFATSSYDALSYSVPGYPYALFSRSFEGDPFYVYSNSGFGAADVVEAINAIPAEAKIGVCSTVSADGASVELGSHTTFSLNDNNGSYSVAYVILEDGISGAQQNYYSGQNMSGQPKELQELASLGSPYRTTFDAIARGIYNCMGIAGSLPMAIANGQTYTHKITVPMPNTISKTANCSVVALLIDNFSGEIVNAAKAKLNEATTGLNTVANGTLAAEISAAAGAINVVAAQGTATVYTADGKLVAKAQVNGAATIAVAKGAYIVRVENGNDVVVKKVVL